MLQDYFDELERPDNETPNNIRTWMLHQEPESDTKFKYSVKA